MKRTYIFQKIKKNVIDQMYAKKINPERAREIVMGVRPHISKAKTEIQKDACIKKLSSFFAELADIQKVLESEEYYEKERSYDDSLGIAAEKLLDREMLDEVIALNDWMEKEKPNGDKIRMYLEFHYPEIAKEVFGENA